MTGIIQANTGTTSISFQPSTNTRNARVRAFGLHRQAGGCAIGLGSATRTYRLRPGALGTDAMILITAAPDDPRIGMLGMLELAASI
jgi:hypothetical protein